MVSSTKSQRGTSCLVDKHLEAFSNLYEVEFPFCLYSECGSFNCFSLETRTSMVAGMCPNKQ